MKLLGIEGGGTSCVIAIAENQVQNITDKVEIKTTTPEETLGKIKKWLEDKGKIDAMGCAFFGPLDLSLNSESYGSITTTPKPGWKNCNIVGKNGFLSDIDCPKGFDTDVNAAAIAELVLGKHGESVSSVCYVTIGTGVGVGIVCDSQPIHGLVHPEAGHFYVPLCEGDSFKGNCPFHKNCVEGLVATGALAERWGVSREDLPKISDNDPQWDFIATYLGHLCSTLTLVVSPQIIVLGGGVMNRKFLFPKIREKTLKLLNGYISAEKIVERIDTYIVPSNFEIPGLIGSLELANRAYLSKK